MGEKIEIYYDGICPTCLKTMPKMSNVKTSNFTGTASGRKRLVSNVNPKPITVPIQANINVCAKYNASPVLFTNNNTIANINTKLQNDQTNAVVVKDDNWSSQQLENDKEAVSIDNFIEQLPGYQAQNLTLNFMITFLFVISATVIGIL